MGGRKSHSQSVVTNTLFSLTGEGERKQWSEVFPPMPTPRRLTACITTVQAIVVAGGYADDELANVEVMDISTKQLTTICPLNFCKSSVHYQAYSVGTHCGTWIKIYFHLLLFPSDTWIQNTTETS